MSFPFDLHGAALSDSHLPSHSHAMLRPCRSSQGHGTARPSRDGLWATCPLSSSSGYHAEFHEVLTRRILISEAGGQCETKHRLSWTRKRVVAAHYKKDDRLHCWTSSSDISGYHADIHEGQRHCRSRAGARHGICELKVRHGRGTAWVRHAMCESGFTVSLILHLGVREAGRRRHALAALRPGKRTDTPCRKRCVGSTVGLECYREEKKNLLPPPRNRTCNRPAR